jgi:hypothetical protein
MLGQTDCENCEWKCPELMVENADAWSLWLGVKTQWRVGMCGAVGLDYTAISFVAKALDIKVIPALLHKIRGLETYMLQQMREKGEKDDGSQ